jgi:nucleoside-diphosphate-sugar epimerase
MKALVTGSEGFIGGYIVRELLSQGFEVVGLDSLEKYGKTQNQSDLKNYQFIKGDARDSELIFELLDGCDHLIAGAAKIGGISYFHTFAYDLLAENERIMASTVDAAIKRFPEGKLKKVTYLSSSMVFESTDRWPSKEGDQKVIPPPLSSYGFQKLAVEYFARAAYDQYQLPFTILRPFNCVGIGEPKAVSEKKIYSGEVQLAMSHVVPDLVQKIVRGQNPLRILGTGEQIRCYTYGGDLAKGIYLSLENSKALNEDFNLSTAETTTVLELAKLIWTRVYDSTTEFNYILEPAFEYDVQKRIPSVDKAKELLDFSAQTSLVDVIDEIIDWVKYAVKMDMI